MDDTILINIMICAIGGVIAGIPIIKGILDLNKYKRCTGKVYGKVINNVKRKGIDINTERTREYWHSICEYTIEETKCTKETVYGTFEPRYEIGQNVEIYYNPQNYKESYVVGETNPKISGIILIIIGIFFIIMILIVRACLI